LLDYGCNQGLFLAFLRQRGYANVFGYDPFVSPYMDQTVFQQQYDFIVSCQVIEHLAQPRYFFDQTVPYLRQKGILLIETPNAAEIPLCDTNGYLPHRNQTLHQPYHQHILSKGALLNLGRAQGLTLVQASRRIEYDTGFPGVNTRAFTTYIRLAGDMLDVVEEPIKLKLLLTSPQLLFYSLLGYFFPPQGLMSVVFRLRSWNCLSKNKN
jgi:SAM-dependent methyltransferase